MFDNLSSKQKKILIVVGIAVIIGVIYFIYNDFGKTEYDTDDEAILVENGQTENVVDEEEEANEEIDEIVVHITGAVKKPGIIRLKQGDRIEDAVELAGGLTEDADISNVNLAYVLEDGVKITIPSDSNIEETEIITDDSGENIIEDASFASQKKELLNINKATQTEFTNLPGIGEELASRIVEYRTTNGNFTKIEDIKNVSGIGESKFEKIKDLISVK